MRDLIEFLFCPMHGILRPDMLALYYTQWMQLIPWVSRLFN